MTVGQQNNKANDPLAAHREIRDKYLGGLSKVMIDAVNSEQYAQATGAWLDGMLTLSTPVREALDKAMVLALEQFSLPSRQQVASLAERLTHVEMHLDDIDAKLDRIIEIASAGRTAAATPAELRQAAKAGTASSPHENAEKV